MNLLITDFDGTFYDDNYEKNINLIKKYDNIDFVIATGRNFESLKKDLKINCKYYICNDGGYILDSNYNIIYRNYIDKDTVKTICSRIVELGYNNYFFDNVENISNTIIDNVNKISVKIKNSKSSYDMKYIIRDLENVYAYISTNWINIINVDSKKEKAIEYIANLKKYDNIYTVGNEINDYDMLKKYKGYFIGSKDSKDFKTIKNFLELENIIKK